MLFAEGIWNDRLESGIRRRASRAARFARSRAPLVQNHLKKNEDTARYGQVLPHTQPNRDKYYSNTCKTLPKCQKGAKRSPKGTTREPQGEERVPNGTNGAPTDPKGSQKGAKGGPK